MAVELKLIKIKPYMHVDYIPCHTKADLCTKMKALSEGADAPPFLEATVYSKVSECDQYFIKLLFLFRKCLCNICIAYVELRVST